MLHLNDVHAYYGKSHILHGVDFRVGEGEIVSLLGRNGVGRSTTIKAIMGEVVRHGSVQFKGRELIDAGCLHADVATVDARGLRAYGSEPALAHDGSKLVWRAWPQDSGDETIVRPAAN